MQKLSLPLVLLVMQTMLFSVALQAQTVNQIESGAGHFSLLRDGVSLFTYVWDNQEIPRPYFCNVRHMDGTAVTRPFPLDPEVNKGNDDHPDFHPGIWMAFGDVNGLDFWRNRARVRITAAPEPRLRKMGKGEILLFNDEFVLEALEENATPIARGTNRFTVSFHGDSYVITWCSTLEPYADEAMTLGDQEEMGLGVRMNTPLTVKFGDGKIHNSNGMKNESGTWGQVADWCSYAAPLNGKEYGLSVYSEKPCWWHTRDYGLMVANHYGKKAMTGADNAEIQALKTVIPKGKRLDRNFALCIFSAPVGGSNPAVVYENLREGLYTCAIN